MSRQDDESEPRVIRVSIETADPLTGTASAEEGPELRFEGWLALLDALSTLACPAHHRSPMGANHEWRRRCSEDEGS